MRSEKPITDQVKTGLSASLTIVRWIFVLPAAGAGFFLAACIGMFGFEALNGWCPGGELVSGFCTTGWVIQSSTLIGALVAPAFVVLAGTLMAPSRRVFVAWTLYAAGAALAIGAFHLISALVAAGISGAIAAGLLHWKYRS
ncbi:MAG: hypothetical protein HY923_07860 [Elusimicrobia bacterium]|nr:hypothetical protein [Elusimicrobiota bacterium]